MEDAFEGFEDDDTTRRQSRRECRWPASSGKGFCKMIIGGNAPHCPRHTCEARGCSAGKPSSKPFCPIHDSTTTLGTTITQTRRELPLPPIPAEHGTTAAMSTKSVVNPVFGMAGMEESEPPRPPPYAPKDESFDGFDETVDNGSDVKVSEYQAASNSKRASSVFNRPAIETPDPDGDTTEEPEQLAITVPNAESLYATHDPDALVRAKRDAFQEKLYDTCPTYASVVDGRTQVTETIADVKYEGDPAEDPNVPRSNIEGDFVPPERDVVNCWEGFKRSPNSKTMVLTLGTFCSLISWLVLQSMGTLIALIVFGVFYLIEAFFVSRTFKYLWNQMSRTKTIAWYEKMVNQHPWVRWYIENYHYETRTYTDSDGRTHTTTVRVTTHTCTRTHHINFWVDASFPFGHVRHKMTKLKMKKHFMWVNDVSRRMHDADFARWERQHTTDVYHFVTWTWGIAGWKSAIFEVEDGEKAPWWIRRGLLLYFFAALSILSWPYRTLLASVVTKRKEHIRKVCAWVDQM